MHKWGQGKLSGAPNTILLGPRYGAQLVET